MRAPANLTEVARKAVEEHGATPGAVVSASLGAPLSRIEGEGAFGHATYDPTSRETSTKTPFDLASVTKSIVALTAARMARRGALRLTDALGNYVREAEGTACADAPLELLLSHRAGVEAHVKIYAPLLLGESVERTEALKIAARSRRSDCPGALRVDGFPPVYSDMGYLLLGAALEVIGGEPLDELVAQEVLRPLGIDRSIGSARQLNAIAELDFAATVAPTEEIPFRGGVVRGLVHDENAFAISGASISGHAGLFGTASSVRKVGEAVLASLTEDTGFLGPADLEPLVRTRPGGSLLAGFDRKSGETPAAGTLTGPRTFGHLGFTGTSLWIDPDLDFVGVLLTNRVHPTREHIAIRRARPDVYDSMIRVLRGGDGTLGSPEMDS